MKGFMGQLWFQVLIAMLLGLAAGLLLAPTGAGMLSEKAAEHSVPWIALPGSRKPIRQAHSGHLGTPMLSSPRNLPSKTIFVATVLAVGPPGDVEHLPGIGLKSNLYRTKGQ